MNSVYYNKSWSTEMKSGELCIKNQTMSMYFGCHTVMRLWPLDYPSKVPNGMCAGYKNLRISAAFFDKINPACSGE